ncbi:MAG TPA: FkbM family methyltransferase [Phycisphaerales bacterium]|nr:FkbM family methyltransferase [Phycisphaerales bacterium]HMP37326.1 FkbM family methyltransferase [Phycisphaerales bacterium]
MPPLLTPLANWVRRQPLLRRAAHGCVRAIPDSRWTTTVEGLGRVRIRLRRHRWFLWEAFGAHDGPLFAAFDRLVVPGDPVWDIGANIGVYTRVLRQWFGAGPIVAIEPMADNFALLTANIALGPRAPGESGGPMADVTALRLALSDRAGEETLQVDDVTSGTAVLDSIAGGHASAGRRSAGLPPAIERVRVERLDDLIATEGLPAPRMMKIDTEGAEVQVLRGALETLRRHRPRLSIALHGVDKAEGTIALLDEVGYRVAAEVLESAAGDRGADGRRPTAWRFVRRGDAPLLANNNVIAAAVEESALLAAPLGTRPPGPRPARTEPR